MLIQLVNDSIIIQTFVYSCYCFILLYRTFVYITYIMLESQNIKHQTKSKLIWPQECRPKEPIPKAKFMVF